MASANCWTKVLRLARVWAMSVSWTDSRPLSAAVGAQGHPRQGAVERVADHRQGLGAVAQHEQLAATHEHVERAIVCLDRVDLHQLVEVLDELVTLVEQVVGGVADAAERSDGLVGFGDLLRQRIDARDRGLHVADHTQLHLVELVGGGVDAADPLLGAREHDLAGRHVLRLVGDVDEGVEQLAGGVAQAGFTGGQHLLELVELFQASLVGRGHGLVGVVFLDQELVGLARDGGDLDPAAEEAGTGVEAAFRFQLHRLA
jgi:hypothetical protein